MLLNFQTLCDIISSKILNFHFKKHSIQLTGKLFDHLYSCLRARSRSLLEKICNPSN